jgi:hypothetical protein
MSDSVWASFFDEENVVQSVAVLCKSIDCSDPVTSILVTILINPLQLRLTSLGAQMFAGRDLTFPYHMMTLHQRQALLQALRGGLPWSAYEFTLVAKHPPGQLYPLDILSPVCKSILANTYYSDPKHRLAVCNIILQRVQASIPLDQQLQQKLNTTIFHSNHRKRPLPVDNVDESARAHE